MALTEQFLKINMEKKGVSPVIATVLIVMITIAAAALLVQFLIPFVKNNLQKSTECVKVQTYFAFDDSLGYDCTQMQNALVSIKAENDEEAGKLIGGFDLVFIGDGSEEAKFYGNATDNLHMLNYSQNVKIPKIDETRTYNISLKKNYDNVEVYPLLASGRICPKSDSIKLRVCNV